MYLVANRRRRAKQKAFSIANKLFPVLKTATPFVAFFEQLTRKDRESLGANFSSATTGNQLKMMANIIGGRMIGVQPFKGVKIAGVVQTIQFNSLINPWTTMGAGAIGYKIFGSALNKITTNMGLGSVIPHTAKIGSLGKGAFGGGLLGSIFDPPESKSTSTPSNLSVGTPQLQVTSIRNSFSGSDSTESGFA